MEKIIGGVNYSVLPAEKIREYVENICKKEWTENDFPVYGDDLYKSDWKLEEILVANISVNDSLLKRKEFQQDLKPRIEAQRDMLKSKTTIPPLILRGSDLLIFDGYARYHLFKELGIKQCLAYVGHRGN
jgi:hypothetical protein